MTCAIRSSSERILPNIDALIYVNATYKESKITLKNKVGLDASLYKEEEGFQQDKTQKINI